MKPNVSRAIEVYGAISRQLGPQYLAYWVLPNTVLTLSGARAYCDGVFWDEENKDLLEVWRKEIAESMEVAKRQTSIIWSEVSVERLLSGQKYTNFELITKDGLRYTLEHTNLLGVVPFDEVEVRASVQDICDMLVTILRSRPKYREYSAQRLHHIAFGIVLGYPDEAILGTALGWGEDGPFAERSIDADIRGASYYTCPQPVYSYPRHLIDVPAIIKHEKLWSGLLKEYYQSDFHRALEKDGDFQRKMGELGNLR